MACSEAQMAANKANSLKAKGPATPEGRSKSALNSLKHGLTGQGIVVAEDVAEEVGRLAEDLEADMKPHSPAGVLLIRKLALFAVRSDRAVEQENAAIALNVRHAADEFDEQRIDRARALIEGLADDPRHVLRKLRKSPEGVDVLIGAWGDLRDDLSADPEPVWGDEQLARARTCSASASVTPEPRGWEPSRWRSGATSRAWTPPTAASTARRSGGSGPTSRSAIGSPPRSPRSRNTARPSTTTRSRSTAPRRACAPSSTTRSPPAWPGATRRKRTEGSSGR